MSMLSETAQEKPLLEECIAKAISKVNARKESELCHYLPDQEGRIHHWAFARLKKTSPQELQTLIETHILDKEPVRIRPKMQTSSLGKKVPEIKFKQSQLSRLLEILKKEGEEELIAIVSPHLSMKQIQMHLIESIRAKKIDQELWETYMRLVTEEKLS